MQKKWFTVFNVKVTARAYDQNMTISLVSSKLLVGLQPNLVWLYNIISQNVLLKNGITAFKVKVTTNFQNVSECLSRLYFLNHRAFCYQIWYGDAASWARVSCRNFIAVVAIFKVKVTVRVIWSKYDSFYYIFWTVDCLATKLGLMIHYHKPEYPVKKVGLHHSGSRSQWRSKCYCLPRWYVLNHQTFCFQTWYCDASLCKSSYDQNMTLATIFSKLLIPW